MCGIAGVFNFRSFAPASAVTVKAMTAALAHRGPDGDGFYTDGALALGHRRLSIIDLSDRGRQPMTSPDGRYVISYNGEVYNYLELRDELRAGGHILRTDSDTEVVLALYAREGARALERLNGMFALAIWDRETRRLFLARDRLGIKPLYYALTRDGIVFASEIKALLRCPDVPRRVARELVDTYMTLGYVPGEETLFSGIRKLLPGHWLTVGSDGFTAECYWDLRWAPDTRRSADTTARELRELLVDAVRIQMRSDVPVGVFLSGGLDSSATVALLAEAGIVGLETFSVAYGQGGFYDETRYARLVADRFHTKHHVLRVDPHAFLDFIPNFVWHMDEPVTEAPAISLYFISKLLRQHVTVALSGEGADELFAGYSIYRYMRWLEGYRRVPEVLRRSLLDPLAGAVGGARARKYLALSRKPLAYRYFGVSLQEPGAADALYTDEFRESSRGFDNGRLLAELYDRTVGLDPLTRMLHSDLKTWLVDDLLIKADKMTMANSVELRVPFLDHRVVEYAATIPSSMKLRGGRVKWILKRAMAGRLPPEILRRRKRGFPVPLASLLRGRGAPYLRDVLLSQAAQDRGYFRHRAIEDLLDRHQRGVADHHELIWKLVVLEEWHRQFSDATQVSRAS